MADTEKPPAIISRPDPQWLDLTSGYLIEQAEIQLTFLPSGEPDFLRGINATLPDPVVRALAEWRCERYKKKARAAEFSITINIPVRRKLDPDLEISQRPHWTAPEDLIPAITRAASLDSNKASQLLANLQNAELPDHNRTSLLLYYGSRRSDAATAIQARRDILLWLIRTFPQDPILTTSFAVVNTTGEPLADSPGAYALKQAWLDAVDQYPKDVAVAAGAANFLRTLDPVAALRIVSARTEWDLQSNILGDLYAFGGLSVDAITPDNGVALATSAQTLLDTGVAASFRSALLASNDLKLVLSGLASTSAIARGLQANHALPAGYDEYCQALMQHTRALYPQTTLDCNPSAVPKAIYTHPVVASAAKRNLLKLASPQFPPKMDRNPPEGSIHLMTFIDTQGHVQRTELMSGPLALYPAARDAVLQWEYKPPILNGKPTNVSTEVEVSYWSY